MEMVSDVDEINSSNVMAIHCERENNPFAFVLTSAAWCERTFSFMCDSVRFSAVFVIMFALAAAH